MNSAIPVIERLVDLRGLLRKKSYFLFGPRQTGKTFWIRRSLGEVKTYDLLDTSVYLALSHNPSRSQRLPVLLNEVPPEPLALVLGV